MLSKASVNSPVLSILLKAMSRRPCVTPQGSHSQGMGPQQKRPYFWLMTSWPPMVWWLGGAWFARNGWHRERWSNKYQYANTLNLTQYNTDNQCSLVGTREMYSTFSHSSPVWPPHSVPIGASRFVSREAPHRELLSSQSLKSPAHTPTSSGLPCPVKDATSLKVGKRFSNIFQIFSFKNFFTQGFKEKVPNRLNRKYPIQTLDLICN